MVSAAECIQLIPPELLSLLAASEDTRAYLVGGFVRDALLGRQNHDLDLAVHGDPLSMARRIGARANGAVVALDPARGTYRVVLREPMEQMRTVDLTRLRAPTLEGDLASRDFTINAIAVPVDGEGPSFIDPTGGLGDLRRKRVKVASPESFIDDPVRLLRVVRFGLELGFTLDQQTQELARASASLLPRAAAERRRDEFMRLFECDNAASGVRTLDSLRLLTTMLPDLEATRSVSQPKEHYYDVFEHSLHTLAALDLMLRRAPPANKVDATLWGALWDRFDWVPGLPQRLEAQLGEGRTRRSMLKVAGLLHDISKPETKTVDSQSGNMRFYGHPELGARRTMDTLGALRLSAREIQYAGLLIAQHLRPGMLAGPGEAPTRRALFRFFRDLGDASPDLLLLNLADHAAARGPRLTMEEWTGHIDYAAWVLRILYEDAQVSRPIRLITGDDLMSELDIHPGPLIGTLLDTIMEAQAAGEVGTREEALKLARATAASLSATRPGG